jgi:hypothetical protein
MNVETGAEAALFPEKEHINGIFVAVWYSFLMFRREPRVKRTGNDVIPGDDITKDDHNRAACAAEPRTIFRGKGKKSSAETKEGCCCPDEVRFIPV